MLFVLGAVVGEGAKANWDRLGGSGVSMARLVGVGALRDRPVTEEGDAGSGIGTPSSGS